LQQILSSYTKNRSAWKTLQDHAETNVRTNKRNERTY
jgi:hypothetical protein